MIGTEPLQCWRMTLSNLKQFFLGAAVAVARRGGTTAALDGINKYFGIAQIPIGTWCMDFIESVSG